MEETSHATLNRVFSPEDQQALHDEDSEAWMAVTGILFVIVTGGALLGIIGVLFSL